MTDSVQTIITQLPNLAVAIWMLWQQRQTIDSLLVNQTKLIDRLLLYVENDNRAGRAQIYSKNDTSAL